MLKFIRGHSTSIKYVLSGLLKTGSHIITGFIVFRWLEPEKIGEWQSIALFASYLNILTLGSTSGLNRDLPYFMGRKEGDKAIMMLQSVGYYINLISKIIIVIALAIIIFFIRNNRFTIEFNIMLFIMIIMGVMGIQSSFYAATYRSANSFNKLSKIQTLNIFLNFLIIPLVFVFNIWGYIMANLIISSFILVGYYYYRPFKVKYIRNDFLFREVVKTGFIIYMYNYLFNILKSAPRLILIIFGTPLLVGLFAPASSLNGALKNLPAYINSYIFPKMNFMFGETDNTKEVYNYSMRIIIYLGPTMFVFSLIIMLITPYAFELFFPKYVDGILTAQIFVFISVFYSVNMVIHNAMYSIKNFNKFPKILISKILLLSISVFLFYKITNDLLLTVAIGSLVTEALLFFIYLYFFNNSVKEAEI